MRGWRLEAKCFAWSASRKRPDLTPTTGSSVTHSFVRSILSMMVKTNVLAWLVIPKNES